jgi:hypothetical protein
MTKQPAANSRKRARGGYRRKLKQPDWSIDGEYLVWNRGGGIRINIAETGYELHYYSDQKLIRAQRKIIEELITRIEKRAGKHLSKEDCRLILQTAENWKISEYFKSGARIVANDQFSDAEKMSFLERVSDLQGFKYGRKVTSLLSKLRWTDQNFINRWNGYVKLIEVRDGDMSAMEIDNRIVQSLPDNVKLFRGFNVPHLMRIRDSKDWLKQQYGSGPYYSLSSKMALSFACRQKESLGRRMIDFGDLRKSEMEIFEGKIVVATFSVPREKIIMYNHASKYPESECICDPGDVSMLSYKFFGIDKFLECDKWYYEWNNRINEPRISEAHKIAEEIAFMS